LGNKITEIKTNFIKNPNENELYKMNGVYGQYTNYIDSKNKYPIEYKNFTIGKLKDKDSLQNLSERFME
jgi:hypothetical protein